MARKFFFVSLGLLTLTIVAAIGSCSRSMPSTPSGAVAQTAPKIVGMTAQFSANGNGPLFAITDQGQLYISSTGGVSWTKGPNVLSTP